MALTVTHALGQMRFELGGGDVPPELDAIGILNQAGHHLYSMHPWRFAVGRSALIDLRGIVSGETATWTAATKTLTDSAEFTDYSFLAGDEIVIESGTGATTGVYKVASRPTANTVTLESSLAAGNLATGDINWRIDPGTIALPTDLRDIIQISTTSLSSVGGVTLVSLASILEMRKTNVQVTSTTGHYYGAVVYTGTNPRPILEIFPAPSANATGAMRIFYRSRWTTLSTDTDKIEIPEFVYDLFIQVARAYAAGYVRNEQATLDQRLAMIRAGPVFDIAKRSDGMVQGFHGQLMGGGPTIWRRGNWRSGSVVCGLANQIEPPAI
jgi:hypothetical protein